jgi:hypothetical protein
VAEDDSNEFEDVLSEVGETIRPVGVVDFGGTGGGSFGGAVFCTAASVIGFEGADVVVFRLLVDELLEEGTCCFSLLPADD